MTEPFSVKASPKNGEYYDLIRVPHGHIPAPLCNFWSKFPIPIKDYRDEYYYKCPECGFPSFYQITDWCRDCDEEFNWDYDGVLEVSFKQARIRAQKRYRKRYFKRFLKTFEYWFLPVLVLFKKAWYVKAIYEPRRVYYDDC